MKFKFLLVLVLLASILVLSGCDILAGNTPKTDNKEVVNNKDVTTNETSEEPTKTNEVEEPVHEHVFSVDWVMNDESHWKECGCSEKNEMAAHNFGEWTEVIAATETENGQKTRSCLDCGFIQSEMTPCLAHEHVYSETLSYDKTSHWKECECGSKSEVSTHNFTEWSIISDSTCLVNGSKERSCLDCGYIETDIIPTKDHREGEWFVDVDATCLVDGTKHQVCADCGTTINTDVILAKGHTEGEWFVDVDATCLVDGSKHQVCADCGTTINTDVILAKGHTEGEWFTDTDSTCTVLGSKHQICAECKETIKIDTIALKEHTPGQWITDKEATTSATGSKHQVCAKCGTTIKTETIPKKTETTGKVPFKSESTIRSNIGSYFYEFTYTTYDGVYNYSVNKSGDTGVAILNGTEYVFIEDDNFRFVYYNDDNTIIYDNFGKLFYLKDIVDYDYYVTSNAQYSKKEAVTIDGRNATKYTISSSKYILSDDKKIYITLDDETGAMLGATTDSLEFYKVTKFKPNYEAAKTAVEDKLSTKPLRFWMDDCFEMVGLKNLQKPEWYMLTASISFKDNSSTSLDNLYHYSTQFLALGDMNNNIISLAESIYDMGYTNDDEGVTRSFDDLSFKRRTQIIGEWHDIINFTGYKTISGKTYSVTVMGNINLTEENVWYVTIAIYSC